MLPVPHVIAATQFDSNFLPFSLVDEPDFAPENETSERFANFALHHSFRLSHRQGKDTPWIISY